MPWWPKYRLRLGFSLYEEWVEKLDHLTLIGVCPLGCFGYL